MGWDVYRLIYRAETPIHIGWHTLGYIKLTRYYIPGRTLWGALTANMVRTGFNNANHESYADMGKIFNEQILYSYFYPYLDQDDLLIPRYTEDGLMYGSYPQAKFERLFIRSFGQTAVLPESNTAENQSLHESEYISNIVLTEESDQQLSLHFLGYVFLSDKATNGQVIRWKDLKPAIKNIFVGGERKYGWGWLTLISSVQVKESYPKIFDLEHDLEGDCIRIKMEKEKTLPAHLEIAADMDLSIRGDIEPLQGRKWGVVEDNKGRIISGAGQEIDQTKICWMPGSVLIKEPQVSFELGALGIIRCMETK